MTLEIVISAFFLFTVFALFAWLYGFVLNNADRIPSEWHEFARRFKLRYQYQAGIVRTPASRKFGEPIIPATDKTVLHYITGTYRGLTLELYYDRKTSQDFALYFHLGYAVAQRLQMIDMEGDWATLFPKASAARLERLRKAWEAIPAHDKILIADENGLHFTALNPDRGKSLTQTRVAIPLVDALARLAAEAAPAPTPTEAHSSSAL